MQLLLVITVLIAVVSGVTSRSTIHSSPRYRGPYFSRPQNNAISSYRPSGRNVLCRYGAYKRDCCYGWKRNEVGTCTPICENSCVHGACVGPNRCKCESGWTGETCDKDYNECSVRPCDHRCMNTPGSYRCYCDHGFILLNDGSSCSRDDRCYNTRCAFGCVQYDDGFNCFCPDGLKLTADGLGCEDVDECSEGTANCPRGRRCSNTYGNYLCLCQEGFKFQYVSGKLTCVDDDECAANRDKCDVNAFCNNLSGGYRCVCKPGYIGTGSKCMRLGEETCEDEPCFEGVKCSDVRLDVEELDYESGGVAQRFECASCPIGYSGDGVDCVASNVDVTVLVVDQVGGAPIPQVQIRAFDVRTGGANEFAMTFTLDNGVAKLPVPNDASIIVVASKEGHLTTSTTYDVRSDENNLVTLTLSSHNDGAEFPYPLPTSRTFSFADPNTPGGQLHVEIPTNSGLNVSDGTNIKLDVRTIDVSDPNAVAIAPELAALIEPGTMGRMEAFAMAEVEVRTSDGNKKVELTEPATLRIPIADRFDTISAGDRVPAWYFDEAIGLWVQDGVGTVEEDPQGGLIWVYRAEHFTWWAAGMIWPGMQLVTVRTCFNDDCTAIAKHTGINVWGVNYMYHAKLLTNEVGSTITFLKTDAPVLLIYQCKTTTTSMAEYTINADVNEIVFKVPDTVSQGCSDPGQVDNGVRIGDAYHYGDEVTYYCNPDFEIQGSSRRVCDECGEWSGYQPFCAEVFEQVSSSSIGGSASSSSSSLSSTPYDNNNPNGSGDGPGGPI